MPEEQKNSLASNPLFPILATICIALSAFSLKWSFSANAEMRAQAVQQQADKEAFLAQQKADKDALSKEIGNLAKAVEALSQNTESDKRQDVMISKFWRLHSWSRSEINKLRVKAGEDIAEWPDLGGFD